jgi:putative transposase
MIPYFAAADLRAAYESRFHFGWYSHQRAPRLAGIRTTIEQTLRSVCEREAYHLLELEIEPEVVRALVSLRPETSPSEVTRLFKGNLAAVARNEHGIRELWSRGWFVRSVGHVTNETVGQYVANQFTHHNAAPLGVPSEALKAGYASDDKPGELRVSGHACFEYNVHLVMVTSGRRGFLDLDLAELLVVYLRRVCQAKSWNVWNLEVVRNHVHLFLGLSPEDAPGAVAWSLLNNAEHFLQTRFAAMLKEEVADRCWRPGYYAGTVGSATTAQVKAFLESRREK